VLDPTGSCVLSSLVRDELAAELLERWSVRRRRRRRALAGVALTTAATAYAIPICLLAGAPARFTIGLAISVTASGIAVSLLAFTHQAQTRWPLVPLVAGLLCEAALGLFLMVEGALRRVLVGDELATLMGLSTVGASLLIQALVTRVREE
jgi:hypothetical protein